MRHLARHKAQVLSTVNSSPIVKVISALST
jgi:hypothetical protein